MKKFVFYKQLNSMDCGPTCLRMIAKYYGKQYSLESLRQETGLNKMGVSLLGISHTAEKLGFRSRGIKIALPHLRTLSAPCVLHWNQNHFVVLIKIKKRIVLIADPAKGILKM